MDAVRVRNFEKTLPEELSCAVRDLTIWKKKTKLRFLILKRLPSALEVAILLLLNGWKRRSRAELRLPLPHILLGYVPKKTDTGSSGRCWQLFIRSRCRNYATLPRSHLMHFTVMYCNKKHRLGCFGHI